MPVSFEVQLREPGQRTRFYSVLRRQQEPRSWSELKQLLLTACANALFTEGVGARTRYVIGMKRLSEGGVRWDLVGLFVCSYGESTLKVEIASLQLGPKHRQIKEEFFMVEKGVKYPEPPLMDRDADRFDPLKASLHHGGDNTIGNFRPVWSQGFRPARPEDSFDSYAGSEYSSDPHHVSRVGPEKVGDRLLESLGRSKSTGRSELKE